MMATVTPITVSDRGVDDTTIVVDIPSNELTDRLQNLAAKVTDIQANVQTIRSETMPMATEAQATLNSLSVDLTIFLHNLPEPTTPPPTSFPTPSITPTPTIPDFQPLLDSVSSLTKTLTALLPALSAVSALSQIQQTISQLPTTQDLTTLVKGSDTQAPTSLLPEITTLLHTMHHNLSGHLLTQTGALLQSAIVAITKGEHFTPFISSVPSSRSSPARPPPLRQSAVDPPRPTAQGPSQAGPSTHLAIVPAAPRSADPASEKLSQKVSLELQKDELVLAGYTRDFLDRCDAAALEEMMNKE